MPSQNAEPKSGMPSAVKQISIAVAVLVVGALIGWIGRGELTGPPSTSTTATVYPLKPGVKLKDGDIAQSWQLVCPSATDEGKHCEITREVYDKDGGRVAQLTIMTKKGEKTPSLVMTVPLGVMLKPGLGLRFSGDDATSYKYATCTSGGCVAVTPFTDKMKADMLAAQDASLILATPGKQDSTELSFSMKQFQKVYSAYKTGEAKRSSLFWRIWL